MLCGQKFYNSQKFEDRVDYVRTNRYLGDGEAVLAGK